jgi:hypothetical protein
VTASGSSATATATRTRTPDVTPTRNATQIVTENQVKTFVNSQTETIQLAVKMEADNSARANIKVFNQKGDLVTEKNTLIAVESGKGLMDLSTKGLTKGIYIIQLTLTDTKGVRVIKKKIALTK